MVHLHNNLVEYHLTEDYLGGNKIEIGSTVANIAYASDHYSKFLVDPRIHVYTTRLVQHQTSSDIFNGTGSYLLTVFNNKTTGSGDAGGMATVYELSLSDIEDVKKWMSGHSIMSALQTYLGGAAMDALLSLKWVPYPIRGDRVNDTSIYIGDQVHTLNCKYLEKHHIYKDFAIFTASSAYSDFRKISPYTKGLMYLPGVGTVELNLSDYQIDNQIFVFYTIEEITGDVTYYIEDSLHNVHLTAGANVAADLVVGQSVLNTSGIGGSFGGIVGGTAAMLAGAASGNLVMGIGGAGAALASATNLTLSANKSTTSISGGIGSRGVSIYRQIVYTEYASVTEDPDDANYIAKMGRPVCETHRIDTHSGFVQTINASVSLDADREEIETVNRMLDAGIYYE